MSNKVHWILSAGFILFGVFCACYLYIFIVAVPDLIEANRIGSFPNPPNLIGYDYNKTLTAVKALVLIPYLISAVGVLLTFLFKKSKVIAWWGLIVSMVVAIICAPLLAWISSGTHQGLLENMGAVVFIALLFLGMQSYSIYRNTLNLQHLKVKQV